MKFDSSRREFLKHTSLGAGALALSPVVHQLQARAAGVAPTAPRFETRLRLALRSS